MSQELDLSISFLEKIGVDMNNWTACYPYGSYDDQSIKMLKERGCKLAVTTEVDIATTNKETRFIMPRLDTNDIPKDKNETQFYKNQFGFTDVHKVILWASQSEPISHPFMNEINISFWLTKECFSYDVNSRMMVLVCKKNNEYFNKITSH